MIKEIALLFLKLGTFAFGGPAAHIAMMEEEVVHKRKWMSSQEFLDMVGATNLIPGPNSTEMAIHCGYHRGGIKGLVTAGVAFIFPAVLITLGLAWIYVEYGNLPAIEPFFWGIKPAVLAIILSAIYRLGKKALKGWKLGLIGTGVLIISLAGVHEVIAILTGGIIGMLCLHLSEKRSMSPLSIFFPLGLWFKSKMIFPVPLLGTSLTAVSTTNVFLVFFKVGLILFGSGYVLVAYLDAELVNRLGWITRQQLLDAIAIGQFTPGPVLSTSTFVGYQIQGFAGALWATVGIFLPSFVFVLILNPFIPKFRQSPLASSFLDAVNISAVAIMVAVVVKMGGDIVVSGKAAVILGLSLLLVFGVKKIGVGWIVVLGSVAGYLFSLL